MKLRLPFKKDLSKKSKSQVTVNNKNKFAIVESYKIARTNIMFSLSASEKKAFAVTSYSKGEGKSTVASNLAISFSKMESKVLLVDCDLRRPNVHNIFKIDNTKGLADVIGKMINFDQAVQKNVLPGLDILVSGTIPPNPSELMCSSTFISLVEQLKEEYDYIIFDTPPIGVVADALLLKELIAGFIVVVRERATTHGDLRNLTESIKLCRFKSPWYSQGRLFAEREKKRQVLLQILLQLLLIILQLTKTYQLFFVSCCFMV